MERDKVEAGFESGPLGGKALPQPAKGDDPGRKHDV